MFSTTSERSKPRANRGLHSPQYRRPSVGGVQETGGKGWALTAVGAHRADPPVREVGLDVEEEVGVGFSSSQAGSPPKHDVRQQGRKGHEKSWPFLFVPTKFEPCLPFVRFFGRMAKKLHKATVKKGHKIAKAILRKSGRSKSSAYAIGMAQAKKSARKRKRRR